jgi:hypothetical protein
MNFSALIKKSFEIAWHNRVLWLFGALSGGVGSTGFFNSFGSGTNFSFPAPDTEPSNSQMQEISRVLGVSDSSTNLISPENLLLIVGGIAVLVLVLLLIFIFVSNWAAAALVYSILQRNVQRPTFNVGGKAGLKYWWKYYLLTLIFGLFILAFLILLIVPGILLFLTGLMPVVIGYAIIAILILIVAGFVIAAFGSLIISLAQRMIIHKGTGVIESIRLSGGLIKKYLGESLLTYIVAIGLNFAAGFAGFIIFLPLIVVFGVLLFAKLWLVMIAAAIPALIFMWAIGGFWNAFQASYWTLFYEHLASKEGW